MIRNRRVRGSGALFLPAAALASVLHLLWPDSATPLYLWGALLIVCVIPAIGSGRRGRSPALLLSLFLSLAGLLFALDVRRRIPGTDAAWEAVLPDVVSDMARGIDADAGRRLDDRVDLLEGLASSLGASASAGSADRTALFDALESARSGRWDAGDVRLLLRGDDGTALAWSGESYLPEEFREPAAPADGTTAIELFRGSIVTAAVLTRRIEGLGRLLLVDHLGVRHHLSGRYARGDRYLDRLSERFGMEVALYPTGANGVAPGAEGRLILPFVVDGHHLGDWSVESITREGFSAAQRSMEERLLPLILLLPWVLSVSRIRRRLARALPGDAAAGWIGRWAYATLFGLVLLAVRWAMVRIRFPARLFGGTFFSPRYFATGLLEGGSTSVGELFLSGLFIALFLLHLHARSGDGNRVARGGALRAGRLAAAFLLSLVAPVVIDRLLGDTLPSLVIEQDFVHSALTLFWEMGLFLLLLSLLLLTATAWRGVPRRAGSCRRSVAAGSLICAALFATVLLLSSGADAGGRLSAFHAVEGMLIFAAGGLLAAIDGREGQAGGRLCGPASGVAIALLAAGILYPAILHYRYRTLEESGEDLLEQMGTRYDNWVEFVLEDAAQEFMDRRREILSTPVDPSGIAFSAWVRSRLSGIGQRTALVISDDRGEEISRFSLTDFEPDRGLTDFFRERAAETEEPFIYHGDSGGSEFYAVVVPFWEEGVLRRFLTVTLPTDLGDRLGGGPVTLFLDESEKSRAGLPGPIRVEVRPAATAEAATPGGECWTEAGEAGPFRRLRREVVLGGESRSVEISFQLQPIGESLARTNFLAIVHGLLLLVLGALATAAARGTAPLRVAWGGTFQRTLTLALFFFSLIPAILFGVVGGREIKARLDEETRTRAREGLDALVRLIERDLGSMHGSSVGVPPEFAAVGDRVYARSEGASPGPEEGLLLDSHYVRDAARTIGHEYLLFRDGILAASSQDDLVRAGLVPGMMRSQPYVDLVLRNADITYHRQSLGRFPYLVASVRLTPPGAADPVVLASPLLWRQEAVDREYARLIYLIVLAGVGILVLSGAMGVVVGRRLSRPIARLMDAFERVGAGDYAVRLEPGRADEFGRLFASFGAMSRQLEASRARVAEEKARVDGVLQSVGAGILAFDRDGVLRVVNARAEALAGGGLAGQVGRAPGELRFGHSDWGEIIRDVEAVLGSERPDALREFVVSGEPDPRTIRLVVTRLVDERGERQGVVAAFEDISESIRSQKILAWGEMARQVAHEIKNPLTPIRLSIQHLQRTFRDGVPDFPRILEEEVRVILREIDRLRRIAGEFSRYAQPVDGGVEPIDVTAVLRDLEDLYGRSSGEIVCCFEVPGGMVGGMADAEGLKKVLVNLIENGREAIDGPGHLTVRLESRAEAEGRVVVLSVNDTGRGIPEALRGRIFDPGFSTRSGGTGLGLAICRRIVEGWGGTIRIESGEGRGTTVEVCLPGLEG